MLGAFQGGDRAGQDVELQMERTAGALWDDVSARLRGSLNETTYHTWFAGVSGMSLDARGLVLGVPNDFAREWIEGHFLDLIRAVVRDAAGETLGVALQVEEQLPPVAPPDGRASTATAAV